jgi:hypothetical protein
MGPVELLVIKFPGNQFKGEIAPALGELVESGTIRIIDLIFATKDENGEFDMVEVRDLESAEVEAFSNFIRGGNAMLSEEDVQYVASTLENGSSAAILLFEDTWAIRFRDSLANANAELIYNIRIPQTTIEEILAEQAEEDLANATA